MKYYIPTSSLNFNNLLSTESISPAGFYERRGFGYRRWISIPENDLEDRILLYAEPHGFSRPIEGMEDHPLLLEYDSEEEFPLLQAGIYYTKRTLYLDPLNTRFLFFTEKDRTIALSMSESSLETKMCRLYAGRIAASAFDGVYPPHEHPFVDSVDAKAIEQDIRINRYKGLFYGYYVGACLSANREAVEKLALLYEIQNIFSAIVSNPDRKPTATQKMRLDVLFKALRQGSSLFQEVRAILERGRGEELDSLVEKVLEKCRANFADLSQNAFSYEPHVEKLRWDMGTSNPSLVWIKKEVAAHLESMKKAQRPLLPEMAELVLDGTGRPLISEAVVPDSTLRRLLEAWMAEVLTDRQYSGKVSVCREALSDALTFKARDVLGESWPNHPIRDYLNDLRRHVRGEAFDRPWDMGVLSSLAAVLSKGNDWTGLLRFMQERAMTDYRLAFAIYGELNGFANLTRDFTDVLLERELSYVANVYGEFHGQIHGQVLKWSGTPVAEEAAVTVAKSSAPKPESAREEQEYQSLKVRVLQFFESDGFSYKANKAKNDSLRNALLGVFRELGDDPHPQVFLEALKEYKAAGWGRSNTPWKLLCKEFCPSTDFARKSRRSGTRMGKKVSGPCLPGLGGSILSYADWLAKCCSLIKSEKAAHCFSDDVAWFVEHWELHPEPQYADKVRDKSNAAVLKRFVDYLEMQRHTTNPKMVDWKPALYKEIPIAEIEAKLREIYGC